MGVNLLCKIKIHEIAKKLNLTSKEILNIASKLNIVAKSHLSGVEEEEAHLAAAHAFEIIVLFARAGHGGVERFADDGDDPRIIPVLKVVAQPMDEVFKFHAFFFELDDGRADKNADLFLCHDVPPL